MKAVECFDAAAMLFLSSRLELLVNNPRVARLTGVYPVHLKAVQALQAAGFDEFITSRRRQGGVRAQKAVKLVKGATRADPAIVGGEIQTFLAENCPSLGLVETDHAYIALQEALENITLHAYPGQHDAFRWYAVGLIDAESGCASVAILDVGVGILETVRHRVSARSLLLSPFQFLIEATSGESTASGDRKRGKGLSTLRNFALDGAGRVLHVLSSGARIVWSHASDRPITSRIYRISRVQ
jgi:hypothetical protein